MPIGNLKLDKLPRNGQVILAVAVGVALAFVGYWFLLRDLIDTRAALKTEVTKLQAEVSQTAAVQQRLAQFKRDLADLDARLNELRRILPSEKETPDIMRAVLQMASDSNLKVVKFVPQPIKSRSFYMDWPISMEVQGSYNGLGRFFEKVGLFARVVNVDNIVVKNIANSTDPTNTLNSNCTATTFVYREDPPVARSK